VGSTICHFIPLPGVTTENWLPAIAAYEGVSMSCGMRAEPKRRPTPAARSRSDADAHATSPVRAAWAFAALDRVAALALVPPARSAAALAAPAARTLFDTRKGGVDRRWL
jgi:hypothetical protein